MENECLLKVLLSLNAFNVPCSDKNIKKKKKDIVCHLWLVSTERYGSVKYGTVQFGMAHPDPACVSNANNTLT